MRGRLLPALFAAAALAALAIYAARTLWWEMRPSGPWSIGFGVAAAVLMALAAAYGLRRRAMRTATRLRLGSAASWLRLHLYGGLLFALLVLIHSGFDLPSGWVTWGLWLLTLWTVASGLAGLALQRWIPRQLASGLSLEAHYDRIPELVAELAERARRLVGESSEPVQQLYQSGLEAALATPQRRLIYLSDITGGAQARLRPLNHLRGFLGSEDRGRLDRLAELYRTKLELDGHYTLQHLLRIWLWGHLPASILLLAFFALHLFQVLYY